MFIRSVLSKTQTGQENNGARVPACSRPRFKHRLMLLESLYFGQPLPEDPSELPRRDDLPSPRDWRKERFALSGFVRSTNLKHVPIMFCAREIKAFGSRVFNSEGASNSMELPRMDTNVGIQIDRLKFRLLCVASFYGKNHVEIKRWGQLCSYERRLEAGQGSSSPTSS